MSEPRELLCMVCDRDYPVWSAPNEKWNQIMRYPDGREASEAEPFVCEPCFEKRAEERGVEL